MHYYLAMIHLLIYESGIIENKLRGLKLNIEKQRWLNKSRSIEVVVITSKHIFLSRSLDINKD